MNILKDILAKRKFAKAEADADELGKAIAPFIDVIGQFALPELKENVKSWSLSNRTLISYLGYVTGVIDAEYQSGFGKSSADDWTATEIVFRQIVEAQLDWIPECKKYFLEPSRLGLELGGSTIGGMQRLPGFCEAMKLGREDFLAIGSPGFFPTGLHKLGLFLAVKEDPFEQPVPEDCLSEKNIFDRLQDHKLSDFGFFRKECLYQIYGYCLVKDRNIRSSDLVMIGTRFINVQDGLEKTNTGDSPDEMIVSCSEPIIARCLTKKVSIDFDNCSAVADNITKYLIFSRGRDEALCLFRLIRMENVVYPALLDEKDHDDYFLASRELRQQVQKVMTHAVEIDMRYVERTEANGW